MPTKQKKETKGSGGRKKLLVISVAMASILGVMVLLAAIMTSGNGGGIPAQPINEPRQTQTPAQISFTPSKYVDDPEVIEIDNKVQQLKNDVRSTELEEDELFPPPLDYDIDFE